MGTATAYTAAGQFDDANTASTSTGDVTGTRCYTFGGSTVAVRTAAGLSLMLGDEQGSTSVVMPVTVTGTGALASATVADAAAVTRTAYTPYGQLRGADNVAVDRGWLGQVEDRVDGATGTGLTYLNARYYDPVSMRFISPDPLMNPADPTTLDPYRYADNNPVMFTDASGLWSCGSWLGRFAMGMVGGGCGVPDGATHAGAAAEGSAEGGQEWADAQVRVFTSDGAKQVAADVGTYGVKAPMVWTTQSVVGTGQDVAGAVTGSTNAVRYNSPASTRDAARHATPVALDTARAYASTMYAAAGVSFGALGPAAAGRVTPSFPAPTGRRLDVDINVDPKAPRVLKLDRPIGKSPAQNADLRSEIARLTDLGAEDIRVNQQQVNIHGVRVGINRPDLQYTLNSRRHYVEWDAPPYSRVPGHRARIGANDPHGVVQIIKMR